MRFHVSNLRPLHLLLLIIFPSPVFQPLPDKEQEGCMGWFIRSLPKGKVIWLQVPAKVTNNKVIWLQVPFLEPPHFLVFTCGSGEVKRRQNMEMFWKYNNDKSTGKEVHLKVFFYCCIEPEWKKQSSTLYYKSLSHQDMLQPYRLISITVSLSSWMTIGSITWW